ncbi:uncharacterized protein LAJ45_01081 [Morchella importuna]|uniref:uncharacterized protein n=1 Tax=Morchella importuna TaxID=1174673 RepID=UPI001E8E3EA5|nr:uncharacterized protein LAJ45_01081 [Morchella importuna]KAH8154553.1 hypothetical protein LAJ45_01081 [Morchella importuna]
MCTQATTGNADHIDGTPTSGHNLQHLRDQLKTTEDKLHVLVTPRKECENFTDADWEVVKMIRDLNMEINRLNSHIRELGVEHLWQVEQDEIAQGGVGLGYASYEDTGVQDGDMEEGGVYVDAVEGMARRVRDRV